MTNPLVARCGQLTVIELDRDLAQRLRARPGIEVIEADVLQVDFDALAQARGQRLRVVGNLPYNISTPILFHLLGAVGARGRPALHAAEGSRRAHGRRARHQGLRAPERDAAMALRHRVGARRAARGVRPAAAGRLGGRAHAAAAGRAGCRSGTAQRTGARWRSRSAASCCATRWAAGSTSAASPASSTCSAAPKKCRWPSTSRWPSALGYKAHENALRRKRRALNEPLRRFTRR